MENQSPQNPGPLSGLRVRTISTLMVVLACALSLLLLRATTSTSTAYDDMAEATNNNFVCIQAASDLKDASNYLTSQSRLFAMTQDMTYAENYFNEELNSMRREAAVETLSQQLGDIAEKSYLDQALFYSNALAEREHYAMLLVMEASNMKPEPTMTPLFDVTLSDQDRVLSAEDKLKLGQSMLFDSIYQRHKQLIDNNVSLCTAGLIESTQRAKERSASALESSLFVENVLTVALLSVVIAAAAFIVALVLRPLQRYTRQIMQGKQLSACGAYDLRYLANAYNEVYFENQRRSERLRHAAEHDPLTGLYNRGAYDVLVEENTQDIALLLIDVDHFKEVNDTYGHEVGDEVLKRVGEYLSHVFRATDFPCRIGGDEFVVIMTGMHPALRHVIEDKIRIVTEGLQKSTEGMPAVTLSIGIAFSEELEDGITPLKAADKALYAVKERGRNGHLFYNGEA